MNVNTKMLFPGESLQPISSVFTHYAEQEFIGESDRTFCRYSFNNHAENMKPGELSLSAEQFADTDLRATDAQIIEMPALAIGRNESRTCVRFGQLALKSNAISHTELVAVKYLRPVHAVQEFMAMRYINSVSKDSAYTPIGLVARETKMEETVGVVTKFEPDVNTLSNILWNNDKKPTTSELIFSLGIAASWLAGIHTVGIHHKDPQPKNIAYDKKLMPKYIDLESSELFKDKNGKVDNHMAREGIKNDLSVFLTSLRGKYVQHVAEYFTPAYTDLMNKSGLDKRVLASGKEIKTLSKKMQY